MPTAAPDRVVLFHDFSEPLGGASFLVQVLIAQLRARAIPVTFIAGDAGDNFSRRDVEFLPLRGKALLQRSSFGAMTTGVYNHRAFQATRRWIARNDTTRTIYHVHGWSKILSPAIFAALNGVADRVILHGHDYFNGCPNGAFFNYRSESDCSLVPLSSACLRCQCDKTSYAQKLWRAGRESLRRTLLQGGTNANRLLMIHPGQADNFRLGGWPRHKLFAVRNPVSPPVAQRVTAEVNRGVLFIGRISAEKGAELAAAAAAKAGAPITFVGTGAEIERVRATNPAATLLGHQDREGVARALRTARVAVMPSRWSEPFGMVALEAVGSGVPVIVSNRALIAGEVERAGFGLALDTTDIDVFARAISQLATDDGRVTAMSVAGHRNYLDLCNSKESWSEAVVEHYRNVLKGRAPVTQPAPGAPACFHA